MSPQQRLPNSQAARTRTVTQQQLFFGQSPGQDTSLNSTAATSGHARLQSMKTVSD